MNVSSRAFQFAGVLLFFCGCLQAVTITPLPYRGNEPGYRLPRGTATFLDQEEGNRIRREMLAERTSAGFYGGSNYDKFGYGSMHVYDDDNRYFGNQIDRDVNYEKTARDYYPNYNPDGSSSNRWAQDCDPRGVYDNSGMSSSNWASSGYNNRRRYYDKGYEVYNRNRGQGFEEQKRGYQPRYNTHRGGFAGGEDNVWDRRGYYGSSDKDDNVGEGTVGFYGRSRRQ